MSEAEIDNNQVPATTEEHREEAPLAINADAVPARAIAATSIRDVLPPRAYENIGQFTLTPDQEKILDEPTQDEDVDVRPDGIVYVSHEYYRRKLNRAFGRMGWTLVPGSPLAQRPGSNEYFQRWVLFVGGVYVAEALSSRQFFETNAQMSLDDVAEAIKSDALRRCCKDLGIAIECWNKRFQEKWKRENAIMVVVKTDRGNKNQWRRTDAPPFSDYQGNVTELTTSARAATPPQSQSTPTPAATAPAPSKPAEAAPKPTEQPKQAQPPKEAPKAAPAAALASAQAAPKAQTTPRLLDSQIRLIFARGRNAGLVVGEDAEPLMEFLEQSFSIARVVSDGKKSAELAHAMLKTFPPSKMNELVRKLDELAKAPKGDAVESI